VKFSYRIWLLLGILYTLYILYSTLVPFNFTGELLQKNLGNVEWLNRSGNSLFTARNFDVIANVLFFIPLGIIIYNIRYAFSKKRNAFINLGLSLGIGLLLSFTIEVIQLFLQERTTSLIDIIMNAMGCFLGAMIAWLFTKFFSYSNRQKIAQWFNRLPAVVYLIPLLLISIFVNESSYQSLLNSENIENIYFSWIYNIEPSWIWHFLYVYIITGALVSNTLKKYQPLLPAVVHYVYSFFLSIILLGIIEIIKISGDISSIAQENYIAAMTGILLGIVFHRIISKDVINDHNLHKNTVKLLLFGFLFLLGLLILYKSLYPFNFNFSREYLQKKVFYTLFSIHSFVPFSGFVDLLVYTIQNILLFIPLGIILNEIERHFDRSINICIFIITSVMLITAAIILKVINDNQNPLLLEVPINVLGIFSGYFLWYGFRKEKKES